MKKRNTLAALVLAAGQGTRMKSQKPKVLHKVCGLPLVSHILDTMKHAGIKKSVVVVGHQADAVKKALKGTDAEFAVQKEQRGTAHAVLSARSAFKGFDGDVLIIAGDVPLIEAKTIKQFYRFHLKHGAAASVLTATVADPTGYGRIVKDASGALVKIVEELDANADEKGIDEINSGMYVFKASVLFGAIQKVPVNAKKKEFYLTDIVEMLGKKKQSVAVCEIDDVPQILGVNSQADLSMINTIMNDRTIEQLQQKGVCVIAPENTYVEANVSVGQDTVIYPFSYIETGVQIGKDCSIGPFATIRKGSRIADEAVIGNFVEVNRSVIKKNTKVKHLSYIGDAEIGPDANIGAGTVTANYDGVAKHKTVVKRKGGTGANTVLVAPVIVGENAKTGAGAVVRAKHHIPNNKVAVGVPARVL